MQNLVEGGQEPSPYLQWQKDMREQDLQEELAKIDRRHLEGRISHDEAVAARTRIMERNRKTAKLTKEEVWHQLAHAAFAVCGVQTFYSPHPPQLFWNAFIIMHGCAVSLIDRWTNEKICRAKAAGGERNERVGATGSRWTQELKNSQGKATQVQARYW